MSEGGRRVPGGSPRRYSPPPVKRARFVDRTAAPAPVREDGESLAPVESGPARAAGVARHAAGATPRVLAVPPRSSQAPEAWAARWGLESPAFPEGAGAAPVLRQWPPSARDVGSWEECPALHPELLPVWHVDSTIPMFRGPRPATGDGWESFILDQGSPLHRVGYASFGEGAHREATGSQAFADAVLGVLDEPSARALQATARGAGFGPGETACPLPAEAGVGFRLGTPGGGRAWVTVELAPFEFRGFASRRPRRVYPGVFGVTIEGTSAVCAWMHSLFWDTPPGRALWGTGPTGVSESALALRRSRLEEFRSFAWRDCSVLIGPDWETTRYPSEYAA